MSEQSQTLSRLFAYVWANGVAASVARWENGGKQGVL